MQPVLPPILEDQLAEYCIEMEEMMFGLTRKDVCDLAYQVHKI